MQRVLTAPVLSYLRQLEVGLKHRFGVRVENVLSETIEFLMSEYEGLIKNEPGIDDARCFKNLVISLGDPQSVAAGYGLDHSPKGHKGYAPGWRICCSRCGISAPASETGMIRVAAACSHKYIGGWCSHCQHWRWYRVLHDLESSNLTDQLAKNMTPEQLRARMHKPWSTIIAILLLVAGSIIGTLLISILVGLMQ